MKEPARRTCLEAEEFKAIHKPSPSPQIPPDVGACMEPGCRCCRHWAKMLGDVIVQTHKILETVCEIAGESDAGRKEIGGLQALASSLTEDNKRYAKANRELNVKANKISVPAAKKKAGPGKAGRPKGQKPAVNCRPETRGPRGGDRLQRVPRLWRRTL